MLQRWRQHWKLPESYRANHQTQQALGRKWRYCRWSNWCWITYLRSNYYRRSKLRQSNCCRRKFRQSYCRRAIIAEQLSQEQLSPEHVSDIRMGTSVKQVSNNNYLFFDGVLQGFDLIRLTCELFLQLILRGFSIWHLFLELSNFIFQCLTPSLLHNGKQS